MVDFKDKRKVANEIVSTGSDFAGYTIEEIRFQRALTAMQADFCKTKFMKSWGNLQKANPLSPNSGSSIPGKAGAVALKLVNGLNYVDYALLGFSLFSGARKVLSFFRRKKR